MVAETLHFGRAAKLLHIAQQPLSYQIKQLEDEVGVKFFERTTRSVTLTPAGVAFQEEVLSGLNRIERGVEQAQRYARGENGILNIAYSNATLFNVMPPILRLFRERFPLVGVALLDLGPAAFLKQILSEDVDVGIMTWFQLKLPGLAYETIFQDALVVALPKKHPLARRTKISLHDLVNEPFVMYQRREKRELFDEFIARCHLAGFSPIITQEASTEIVLIGLVTAGLGVTIVPGSLRGVRTDEVAYRPLVDPLLPLDVSLVWKQGRQFPLLTEIRQIAREVAKQMTLL